MNYGKEMSGLWTISICRNDFFMSLSIVCGIIHTTSRASQTNDYVKWTDYQILSNIILYLIPQNLLLRLLRILMWLLKKQLSHRSGHMVRNMTYGSEVDNGGHTSLELVIGSSHLPPWSRDAVIRTNTSRVWFAQIVFFSDYP